MPQTDLNCHRNRLLLFPIVSVSKEGKLAISFGNAAKFTFHTLLDINIKVLCVQTCLEYVYIYVL